MNVLLFGADGQVGQAMQHTVPPGACVHPVTRAQVDLQVPGAIATAIGQHPYDWVVNAAAYTAVDQAESEPDLAHAINAAAVGVMAQAAAANGARLAHISTDFVFDGEQGRPYQPSDPARPLSVYGATKLEGEAAAGQGALIVRTSWVYRAGHGNFVHTMLRLMAEKSALSVVADQIGSPTHASSLAGVLWQLMERSKQGLFHLSDSGVASWYDFAVAIQEEALALGLLKTAIPITPIATQDYPTPAIRPAFSVLDKSKTWAAIGGPLPHWRSALKDMLRQVSHHG